MITGTYNLVVDPQWRNVQQQEVFLECDTKDGQVTINLFEIANLNRFWNVKIVVSDVAKNASVNNILINAGGSDFIDETSVVQVVLNLNGESVTLQPVSENGWIAIESVNATPTPTIPTLQEVLDNNHDLVDGINTQGNNAGLNNTGSQVNFFGGASGLNNTGSHVNALGSNSAENNTGLYVNAFGQNAGRNNQRDNVNAFGANAGNGNTAPNTNFFGSASGAFNTGNNVHAFGTNAGRKNSGRHAVFFGDQAGYDSNTDTGNSLGSVFVINNSILPSFPDSPTAQLAITVANGAVAGNTYLYYNSGKLTVEAVRL